MNWLSPWEGFVKVVEQGSMAAAARSLDCTRAQISRQIADLEKAFGVRLLERSTRKLLLTPSGEVFYQHARRALEAVAGAEVAVRNTGDAPRGVLRISASVSFGRHYIAPLLPRLTTKYPDLRCELVLTDQLVDLVDDNIDLALRHTRNPPEDVVARRLVAIERRICATPAYLARHGEPLTPQELAGHQCFTHLFSEQLNVWRLVDAEGNEIAVPVDARFQFDNIDCVLDAVLAGHGLAILPTYLCGPEIARARLQAVLADYRPLTDFGRHVYACYTPSRVRVPKVRVFLAELAAMFEPSPPWEQP